MELIEPQRSSESLPKVDVVIPMEPQSNDAPPDRDLMPPHKKSFKITEAEKAAARARLQAKQERKERKEAAKAAKKKGDASNTSVTRKVVSADSPFRLAPHDLTELVDFDKRDDPKHIALINSKHGGLAGIADLLGTSLQDGLPEVEVKQNFSLRTSW